MPRSDFVSFASTRWSLVAAADASETRRRRALDELCRTYWRPLYAFLRRGGCDPPEAEDLVQGFLADLLARGDINRADPQRGRFRTFLLAALKHYAAKQRDAAAAAKRGGRVTTHSLDRRSDLPLDFAAAEAAFRFEPSDDRTPEDVFARQWALAVLQTTLARLEAEQVAAGRGDWFALLKGSLAGEPTRSHQSIADQLGTTPGTVKAAAARLRQRYRDLLDAELGDGVVDAQTLAAERAALLEALQT